MKTGYKKSYLIPAFVLILAGIAASYYIEKGEPELWLNGKYNQFLDYFFYFITEIGTGYFFALIAVTFLFYRFSIAFTLGIQGILATLITNILKHLIFTESPRPPSFFTDHSALHFFPGSPLFYNNSFPSGHSITILVLCTTLTFFLPSRYSLLMLLLATLVLISRMYLLRHFIVDVSVGGFIGLTISVISTSFLFQFFDKKFGTKTLLTLLRK